MLIFQALREFFLNKIFTLKTETELFTSFCLFNLLHSFIFQDIPGIVAFLSAKDIPGKNSFIPVGMVMLFEDEEVSLLRSYKRGW